MSSSQGKAISNSQRGKLPSNHDSSDKSGLSIKNSEHDPSRHRSAASSKYKVNHRLVEETQPKEVAKQRWSILKEAILDKKLTNNNSTVRRFDSFGFVKCVKVAYNTSVNSNNTVYQKHSDKHIHRVKPNLNNQNKYYSNNNDIQDANTSDDDDDICVCADEKSANSSSRLGQVDEYEWFSISVPTIESMDSVKVRFYKGPIGLKEMVGFNNTGNVCLWPSEEIMTYFCIKNSAIFDNKSVCELGGGMTCLAGLMISRCSQPTEVFLTDGNENSFENLEVICSDNEFRSTVECCLLQWSKDTNYGDLEGRFDYIICADCLFFDEFREDLCATIWKLLKLEGTCLIFAPNRSNTFHKFVDMAKLHFECMIVHDYDMEVWERHQYEKDNNPDYDEDLHYPLLLKLKKRKRTANVDFCKMVL